MCGILFYCRNGEKSTAIKRMQTVQDSLLYMCLILFDFILNIPVNNFSVMSAHSTKIKMRGSREGVQKVLTFSLENRKPLGFFSNTGPDPLENQKLPSQHSILGNYRPTSVLLLGWWWSAFSGILLPHSIHLKKVCHSLVGLRLTISGSAHD